MNETITHSVILGNFHISHLSCANFILCFLNSIHFSFPTWSPPNSRFHLFISGLMDSPPDVLSCLFMLFPTLFPGSDFVLQCVYPHGLLHCSTTCLQYQEHQARESSWPSSLYMICFTTGMQLFFQVPPTLTLSHPPSLAVLLFIL